MAIAISNILDILRAHDIVPNEELDDVDLPSTTEQEIPQTRDVEDVVDYLKHMQVVLCVDTHRRCGVSLRRDRS